MARWFKILVTIGIFLICLSLVYTIFIQPKLLDRKLQRCLELGQRGEIEGLERNTLGYYQQPYFDNCYKRYR